MVVFIIILSYDMFIRARHFFYAGISPAKVLLFFEIYKGWVIFTGKS